MKAYTVSNNVVNSCTHPPAISVSSVRPNLPSWPCSFRPVKVVAIFQNLHNVHPRMICESGPNVNDTLSYEVRINCSEYTLHLMCPVPEVVSWPGFSGEKVTR